MSDAGGGEPRGGGSSPTPPPREDPWEKRERMLARYNRRSSSQSSPSRPASGSSSGGGGSRRPRSDADEFPPAAPDEEGLPNNANIAALLGAAGLLLLTEVPRFGGEVRKIITLAGAAILLLTLAGVRRWRPGVRPASLLRAPALPLLLLTVWGVWSFGRAPYREFAALEAARLGAGLGAFLLAAYTLRTTRQLSYATAGLLVGACLLALGDVAYYGQTRGVHGTDASAVMNFRSSFLGTHEDAASLFLLALPVALSIALTSTVEEKRRLAATAASLILGAALLVARTRSAWVGGLVAVVILAAFGASAALSDRRGGGGKGWRGALASPAALIALGMFGFVLVGGAAPLLAGRSATLRSLSDDGSFRGRVEAWAGAARMAAERPVFGAGLGAYPVEQGRYTHFGAEGQRVLVDRKYAHPNIAHNYYLQWAAETGLPGLFLYLLTILTTILGAAAALPRMTRPFARAVLIGTTAGVAGASVDALATSSYNFAGVGTAFWLVAGLGVAAAGLGRGAAAAGESEDGPRTPWWAWAVPGVVGAAALAAVPLAATAIQRQGARTPAGSLRLSFTPARIQPGQRVRWTARFIDGYGRELPTAPGTIWYVSGDPTVSRLSANLEREQGRISRSVTVPLSVFSVTAPATRAPLVVRAQYCDRYGRWYNAWSFASVAPPAPVPLGGGAKKP